MVLATVRAPLSATTSTPTRAVRTIAFVIGGRFQPAYASATSGSRRALAPGRALCYEGSRESSSRRTRPLLRRHLSHSPMTRSSLLRRSFQAWPVPLQPARAGGCPRSLAGPSLARVSSIERSDAVAGADKAGRLRHAAAAAIESSPLLIAVVDVRSRGSVPSAVRATEEACASAPAGPDLPAVSGDLAPSARRS
jgi:hypothetical protein